jgi:hypothetical protein
MTDHKTLREQMMATIPLAPSWFDRCRERKHDCEWFKVGTAGFAFECRTCQTGQQFTPEECFPPLPPREAPADAPPATDCGVCDPSYPLPKGKWTCSGCGREYPAKPAAEPPAPPAQVLDLDALETEHKGCEDYGRDCHDSGHAPNQPVMSLIAECRALRAGVARLQEELAHLKAAQEAPK